MESRYKRQLEENCLDNRRWRSSHSEEPALGPREQLKLGPGRGNQVWFSVPFATKFHATEMV
jgi:hypothetical protein